MADKDDLRARKIEPRAATQPAKAPVSVEGAARALLFGHVEDELLTRMSFDGEKPRDEAHHTQEYLLIRVYAHLERLAESMADESKAKAVRGWAEGVNKIRKGLEILAQDSVFSSAYYQDLQSRRAKNAKDLHEHFAHEGYSEAQITEIFDRSNAALEENARRAFVQDGYDKVLDHAGVILQEAAQVMAREWEEKKDSLTAETREELWALMRNDDDISPYVRRRSNAGPWDVMADDPEETLAAYTDAIKAQAQALLSFSEKLAATLTPALSSAANVR